MTDEYDVVVVGAGPAGSAAALGARGAGARVLLLDRSAFPRDKVCGDGIAPHAADVLATLGASGVLEGYRPVSRLRVTAPSGMTADRVLRRVDWVVPRAVLDDRLRAQARRAGAEVARRRVRTVRQRADGVCLDGEVHARVLVGADGASSVVRRQLGLASNPLDHLAVAVRGYAPTDTREQAIVMSAAHWPSYAWSFPVGDGTANVGYGALRSRFQGTRADLVEQMEAALGPTGVDPATLRGHPLPLSSARPALATGRVLLTGDAASLINPLSGEGIYYALATGALAGRAAAEPATAARRYTSEARRLLGRHLRATALVTRMLDTPLVAQAAVRAARRSQAVFDDLCELTLGRGTVSARLAAGVAGGVAPRIVAGWAGWK